MLTSRGHCIASSRCCIPFTAFVKSCVCVRRQRKAGLLKQAASCRCRSCAHSELWQRHAQAGGGLLAAWRQRAQRELHEWRERLVHDARRGGGGSIRLALRRCSAAVIGTRRLPRRHSHAQAADRARGTSGAAQVRERTARAMSDVPPRHPCVRRHRGGGRGTRCQAQRLGARLPRVANRRVRRVACAGRSTGSKRVSAEPQRQAPSRAAPRLARGRARARR
jgi:hypothetical protein